MIDFAREATAVTYPTSFGDGWVAFRGDNLIELGLPGAPSPYRLARSASGRAPGLAAALAEFWRGGRLPRPPETVFRDADWTPLAEAIYRHVSSIPPGLTMTYAAVAAAVGRPGAARAVGAAMAANRFAPMIPCHRVVGSGGALRGYAGGLAMKRYLIDMESGAAHA